MAERWLILAVLTFARTAMGLQFQSVAAVSSSLIDQLQMSYAALGTLVGLYLLPGVAVALPGGMLAQRFGDKRIVAGGLGAMVLGGVLMGLADGPALLSLGRIISGAGAVLLNVLLTKMVTDWFEGRELVTALGVLITSWPLGIAIGLVGLPALAKAASWPVAMLLPAAVTAGALLLVAFCYRPAPEHHAKSAGRQGVFDLAGRELGLATLAGLVWTFYNVGLIVVLTFGPDFLVARGYTPEAASAVASTASWIIIPALPAGAWLAQRIGRPDTIMLASFLLAAATSAAIVGLGPSIALFAALGLIFAPAGALIMALPGEAATPERRAIAMGVYFTCYYAGMGLIPAAAGIVRDASGDPATPLWFAAALLLAAGLALIAFRQLQTRLPSQPGREQAV